MIDLNKEYTTRDGRPVKLAGINEDAKNMAVLGWVKNKGKWVNYSWCINGRLWHDGSKSHNDLIEVPEFKRGQVWQNKWGLCYFITSSDLSINANGIEILTSRLQEFIKTDGLKLVFDPTTDD